MKRNVSILFNMSSPHPTENVNLKNHNRHQFFVKFSLIIFLGGISIKRAFFPCTNGVRSIEIRLYWLNIFKKRSIIDQYPLFGH